MTGLIGDKTMAAYSQLRRSRVCLNQPHVHNGDLNFFGANTNTWLVHNLKIHNCYQQS